jgi:uncharacterized protein (DUF2062 family)
MSLRSFIKRHLPHRDHFHKQGGMHLLSDFLHDPNIWHVHKRSSAGGAAIGVFCAFIPFPVQMLSSAVLAILFRMNLPIAVLTSFISNPFTIPPIFYFSYVMGVKILGIEEQNVDFSLSIEGFGNTLMHAWEPLLLGCFIMGTICSTFAYILVRLIWRVTAIAKWENRRNRK